MEREARELRGELGAAQIALRDLTFQRVASEASVAAAEARLRDFTTLVDRNRTAIATLADLVSPAWRRGWRTPKRGFDRGEGAPKREWARLAAALGEAEARLARSEAAREEALLENGRQLARLAERDAACARSKPPSAICADQLKPAHRRPRDG